MSTLQDKIASISNLFDSRNERERILIVSCFFALIYTLWQFLFYDAASVTQTKLDVQIKTLETNIKSTEQQYAVLLKTKRVDPNSDIKQRLSIAQQHLDKLNKQLMVKMEGLILPTQMAMILQHVLTQQTPLKFVRLQSLAAKPLIIENADDTDNVEAIDPNTPTTSSVSTRDDTGVFQHGIEMEFSGSYLDTLQYLKKLEQLSWNFYWDAVLFDVQKYPKSKVIIRVHTLSLEEGWLGV